MRKNGDTIVVEKDGERYYGKIVRIDKNTVTVDIDCRKDFSELVEIPIWEIGEPPDQND